MSYDRGRRSPDEWSHSGRMGGSGGTPGKRTLTQGLPVQRRADPGPQAQRPATPSDGGAPLPGTVRGKMEASFGVDFSSVRVHEGTSAPALGAVALTQGNDIHFAPGQYDPTSARGQELLGHELTHVVQQRANRVALPQAKGTQVNGDMTLEAEADALGARAARGEWVGSGSPGAPQAASGDVASGSSAPAQALGWRWDANRQEWIWPHGGRPTCAQPDFPGDALGLKDGDEFDPHGSNEDLMTPEVIERLRELVRVKPVPVKQTAPVKKKSRWDSDSDDEKKDKKIKKEKPSKSTPKPLAFNPYDLGRKEKEEDLGEDDYFSSGGLFGSTSLSAKDEAILRAPGLEKKDKEREQHKERAQKLGEFPSSFVVVAGKKTIRLIPSATAHLNAYLDNWRDRARDLDDGKAVHSSSQLQGVLRNVIQQAQQNVQDGSAGYGEVQTIIGNLAPKEQPWHIGLREGKGEVQVYHLHWEHWRDKMTGLYL